LFFRTGFQLPLTNFISFLFFSRSLLKSCAGLFLFVFPGFGCFQRLFPAPEPDFDSCFSLFFLAYNFVTVVTFFLLPLPCFNFFLLYSFTDMNGRVGIEVLLVVAVVVVIVVVVVVVIIVVVVVLVVVEVEVVVVVVVVVEVVVVVVEVVIVVVEVVVVVVEVVVVIVVVVVVVVVEVVVFAAKVVLTVYPPILTTKPSLFWK